MSDEADSAAGKQAAVIGDMSRVLSGDVSGEPVAAVDAATVVPIRTDETGQLQVLMLKRNEALDFAPGSWVFPGGRVDEADPGQDRLQRLKSAAIRETKEESNLDLHINSLFIISKWTTPEAVSKRFATWFFLADCDAVNQQVSVDQSEIVDAKWLSPSQALGLQQTGEMEFLPPAFVTLTELSRCRSVAESLAFFRNRKLPEILPKFSVHNDVVVMLYPGDIAYQHGDPALFDPERAHRVLMKPGDWQYLDSGLT